MLAGSITSLGQQYVLGLRAEDCRTGNVLDEEQAQASRKEDVLNVLSQIAGRFRKRIGESLTTIEKHNIPLAEATTTSSRRSAHTVSVGMQYSGLPAPARRSRFSSAPSRLTPTLRVLTPCSAVSTKTWEKRHLPSRTPRRAYQLRDRTSDPERFFIESSYDLLVTGNLEKARQTSELWSQTYPRDERPVGLLSFIYQDLGRYDKSIDTGKRAIEIDRDFVPGYANLAWAYVLSDRLTEAQHVVQLASERKLEFPDLYILLYDIAFLQNDKAGMERAVALAHGKTGGEHWIMQREACVLAYTGHIRDARAMSRRAIQLAEQAGQPGRAELYRAGVAAREALFGNSEEAKRQALAALGASKDRDVEYGAAFALAMSGDTARVANIIDDLDKRFPEDTFVRFSYLPTLRALVAEHHGNPTKALEYLEAESPYDLGIAGSWAGFLGDMYPVYVRGLAYLALQQGREASVEFQKIVTHRGIVGSDPVVAAALLKLAQAYAIAGEKSKADSAYQQFFALWNDADPDTPVLQLARQEYSTSR